LGDTWASAKRTLQPAIAAASLGDQVWVAAGTYVGCIVLKDGVALYGGFPAAGGDWATRDAAANVTTLDGSQQGSVVTVPAGCGEATLIDGFTITHGYSMQGAGIFCGSEASPRITANVITGNHATSSGGGIWCANGGRALLSGNSINSNSAQSAGGGLLISWASPTLTHNNISGNNTVEWAGAGIECNGTCSPTISTNTVAGNRAGSGHAGIHIWGASPAVENNNVTDNNPNGIFFEEGSAGSATGNTVTGNAGIGIGVWSNSSTTVQSNVVSGSLPQGGWSDGVGIAACQGSSGKIERNTVEGNGFGIWIDSSASPTVTGNLVRNNRHEGFHVYQASPCLSSNTVDGNETGAAIMEGSPLVSCNQFRGNRLTCLWLGWAANPRIVSNVISGSTWGISSLAESSPTITNNTLTSISDIALGMWNSSPTVFNNIVAFCSRGIGNFPDDEGSWGRPTLAGNCVFGNTSSQYENLSAGPGDISADPLFANASTGDYHLLSGSLCINAGANWAVEPGWKDLDGNPRIAAGIVDIGAYEYAESPEPEQVTVDFSIPVTTPSMSGILHGITDATPPDSAITPIKPHLMRGRIDYADRAISLGARYEFLVSESYGYPNSNYRGRGGPWENWTAWEDFVRGLARQYGSKNMIWEVWNEPDIAQFWTGTKEQFFETYSRAYKVLRQELGTNVLIGNPSLTVYNADYIRQFLDYCKAQNCEVNVLTWHELAVDQDIPSVAMHLGHAKTFFQNNPDYAALNIKEIHVNEIVGPSAKHRPGDILGYFYNLEVGGANGACKGCWEDSDGESSCWNGTLAGLLTPTDYRPRAAWWAYKYYADGVGQRVKSETSYSNIAVLGSAPAAGSTDARVLVGAFETTGAAMPAAVHVKLKGLGSLPGMSGRDAVPVWIRSLADSGETAVAEPTATLLGVFSVDEGTVSFDITSLQAHGAALLSIGDASPTVSITAPTVADTYATRLPAIDLAGTASDDFGVASVAWSNDRGGSGTCTGTTAWSAAGVTLQQGVNVITVTATDTAGHAATDTLTVTLDQQGPTVTITSPTNLPTYSVYGSSITLTGTASDSGGVASVTWMSSSGASGGCIGTGLWLAAGVPLVDGANVITVAAVDTLGNQGTDTITITKLPGTGAVSIAEAKKRANNQDALLLQKVVTYATADVFYIEEDSRACGIRVEKAGHGLVAGMRADVYGTLKSNASKERYIAASHAEHDGSGDMRPLFMNTAGLGGGPWSYNSSSGAGQSGVVYGTGLNNIGLLVKTCGYYTQIDSSSFVVDDGTGLNVKCVVAPGVTLNPSWECVVVTGVSSIYKWNSAIYPPVILVGSQACISLPGGGYSGEMVHIPAGEFLMGNSGNETYVEPDELPQHPAFLSAYSIGKHEVTRGEFREFLDAGGYADPQYWSAEGWAWKLAQNRTQPDFWDEWQDWGTGSFQQTENHPVVGVRYYEAEAFCKWAGGRLPTEAEWERAARWYDDYPRTFPWGDDWSREKCNTRYDHNAAAGGYMKNQTAPVGSYVNGANPLGCVDMAGNVWEYCSDWYSADHYSAAPTGGWINPTGPATGSCHILRGGGWANEMKFERCADRNDDSSPPSGGWQATGFRVAR
jgi:xylan 1,4-beta-xylosidase